MERMEVRRKIIRIARRRLRVRKGFTITDEANFVNDLGADSLRSVDLVMEFEDEFKIKSIPDADGERMTTMGKAVDYITWVLNGSQGRNPLDDVEVDPGSGALGSPSMFKDGVGL